MPEAIFYLTYNGIYNFTNGIGTQTQLLLRGLEHLQPVLTRQYGPIHLHVVCPLPDEATWGYDPQFLQTQQQRLAALGGQLHFIPYKVRPADDLWDVARWHTLCAEAARLLKTKGRLMVADWIDTTAFKMSDRTLVDFAAIIAWAREHHFVVQEDFAAGKYHRGLVLYRNE